MPFVLIRHKIEDYPWWKSIFDKDENNRRFQGSLGSQVFKHIEKPDEIFVLLEWDEWERAQRFFHSADLHERMKSGKVKDMPDVFFLEEVSEELS